MLRAFREWAASWFSSGPQAEREGPVTGVELGTVLQNSSGSASLFVGLAQEPHRGSASLDEGLSPIRLWSWRRAFLMLHGVGGCQGCLAV